MHGLIGIGIGHTEIDEMMSVLGSVFNIEWRRVFIDSKYVIIDILKGILSVEWNTHFYKQITPHGNSYKQAS